MRILLIASAFNSLTQRVFVELDDRGHEVGASVTPTVSRCGRPSRRSTRSSSWLPI
jgi:hypothetical protein